MQINVDLKSIKKRRLQGSFGSLPGVSFYPNVFIDTRYKRSLFLLTLSRAPYSAGFRPPSLNESHGLHWLFCRFAGAGLQLPGLILPQLRKPPADALLLFLTR